MQREHLPNREVVSVESVTGGSLLGDGVGEE